MCRAFSSVQPAVGRLLPLIAIAQGVATVAQEWRQVEELRESRLLKEQELRQERARMRVQLRAFEGALAAQVGLEQARGAAFAAAMNAISPVRDPTATARILDMAAAILDRPLPMPAMNADWAS